MDANKVELSGNMARDAETLQVGQSLKAKLRLSSKRQFTKKDGSPGEEVTFLTVTAWRELAESVKDLKRGDRVLIRGRLRSFSVKEKKEDGTEKNRSLLEVEAQSVSRVNG